MHYLHTQTDSLSSRDLTSKSFPLKSSIAFLTTGLENTFAFTSLMPFPPSDRDIIFNLNLLPVISFIIVSIIEVFLFIESDSTDMPPLNPIVSSLFVISIIFASASLQTSSGSLDLSFSIISDHTLFLSEVSDLLRLSGSGFFLNGVHSSVLPVERIL